MKTVFLIDSHGHKDICAEKDGKYHDLNIIKNGVKIESEPRDIEGLQVLNFAECVKLSAEGLIEHLEKENPNVTVTGYKLIVTYDGGESTDVGSVIVPIGALSTRIGVF